jgi:hypothetical protein
MDLWFCGSTSHSTHTAPRENTQSSRASFTSWLAVMPQNAGLMMVRPIFTRSVGVHRWIIEIRDCELAARSSDPGMRPKEMATGECYADPGPDYYTRHQPLRTKDRAIHQLEALGYHVTLEPLQHTG